VSQLGVKKFQVEASQWGVKYPWVGKIRNFTASMDMVQDRPKVMER